MAAPPGALGRGLLAGDVSVMLLNLSSIEEHAKAGKVRILAAASSGQQRSIRL